jgi:hypothetical protein
VDGCFAFGFDQDDADTIARTWDFIQESELSEVQVTLLTPFPGTALAARLRSEGRLLADRYWDRCTLFDLTFEPRNFTVSGLQDRFRDMVELLYAPGPSRRRASERAAIHRKRGARA